MDIRKGDKVEVSDGTPQPPRHHTRKLSRWKLTNFTGWVHRVDPDGAIAVDETGRGMGCMVVRPWELTVRKLED